MFLRFLRRHPDSESDPEVRTTLRKRIDIVRGVVRSGDYGRSGAGGRGCDDPTDGRFLHEMIFAGRDWQDAALTPSEERWPADAGEGLPHAGRRDPR